MLFLGADHNGYWLKEELKSYLSNKKVAYKDVGALSHRKGDDYPDYALRVVYRMRPSDIGILICGSGHGMTIAANRRRSIRAALATTNFSATKAREDDHANILVLSAWELSVEKAKRLVATFLSVKPSNAERHLRRLKKINRIKP